MALTYALTHPERVSHLILLSTPAWWKDPAPLRVEPQFPETEEEMRVRLRETLDRSVYHPEVFARSMDELLPQMRFSPDRLKWVLTVGAKSYDVRGRLEEIRVPTLVLHGREDKLVPLERAEELHRGIPDSRLVAFEGCGHWPPRREAQRVRRSGQGVPRPRRAFPTALLGTSQTRSTSMPAFLKISRLSSDR